MSRSMQLHYIPVEAFSLTDLYLDWISQEWDSSGSAMTNHKKLILISLCLWTKTAFHSQKERHTKNRLVSNDALT